jgi:hypothetical protein
VGAGLGVQPILQVKIIRRRLAADVPRAGEHPASTTTGRGKISSTPSQLD